MAETYTIQELEDLIAELQKGRAAMSHENHRICVKCHAVYMDKSSCWCDYVSDWYYGDGEGGW